MMIKMGKNFLKTYFNINEKNLKTIFNKNILIVGCGGIGSNISKNLLQMGFNNISIIDCDIVEKENLSRQFFFENQIGKFKVDCLFNNLKLFRKKVNIKKFKKNLTEENYKIICKNIDLIIDCSDNITTRFLIEKISHELKIDWIYLGAIKDESISSIFYHSDKSKYFKKVFKKKDSFEKCQDSNVLNLSINMTNCFCNILIFKYFFDKKKYRKILKFKLKNEKLLKIDF